ncbi:helix-turn-helix transcriptional regulator [Labilibacter marinus]|uniref:helix-turn-helix transcriptional regulator n=1 Tax=Labilibacter marinus TaxID=1477105 RepID=UPI00082B17EE|nr:AraC family transcriptional regulator [Labilibacter marinus]
MILETHRELFEYVLAPLVSAQLFITILFYFIVVRRRIAADYKLYNLFLVSFIIFLVGRLGWFFLNDNSAIVVLYIRMGLLMGLGIPSLLIAAAKQSGIQPTKYLYSVPYSIGLLLSLAYIIFYDAGSTNWFYSDRITDFIGIYQPINWAHNTQIVGALLQLIIPCTWLIIKEIRRKKQLKLLLFLAGAFLFGITLVIGVGAKPQNIGLYYIGSIPTGIMWIWAVFLDIRDMKGKVGLLKEELQFLLRSGMGSKANEINALLANLEELSQGNLDIYKMRIREILNMLTDTTIEAGGNTEVLIQRNAERANAIEKSSDTYQVKEIIMNEALELSEIMTDIPLQKNTLAIDKLIEHLKNNFSEDYTADDFANIAGLSKAHLMREFKKKTGLTINQFHTKLRVEQAKKLLAENKTVANTAYQVGYNNPNYFSTVFKRMEGLSPLEFQDNNKLDSI